MTDKLFCVTLYGHYSMSCGWDDGWNIGSVYPCTIDGNVARFTVRDRDYDCKIKMDFVDRWGGYWDIRRDAIHYLREYEEKKDELDELIKEETLETQKAVRITSILAKMLEKKENDNE